MNTLVKSGEGRGWAPACKRSRPLTAFIVIGIGMLVATMGLTAGTAMGANNRPLSSSASSASPADTVAILFPDNTTPRWMSEDAPDYRAWMQQLDPSSKVLVDVANEDPSTQLSQAQAALTEGAKVLVVIAVDSVQAAKIVLDAQADNVPVIAYTREIYNTPVKYMTGDDPYQIGLTLGSWMVAHTKPGNHIAVIAGSTTDSFAHAEYSGYMKALSPVFKSGATKGSWPGVDPRMGHHQGP